MRSLASSSKRCAQLEMVVEALARVDRELHDRDRGVGEGVYEDRPRAMVDAPGVDVHADPGGLDDVVEGRLGRRRATRWCTD
jgi:hypothetical protein